METLRPPLGIVRDKQLSRRLIPPPDFAIQSPVSDTILYARLRRTQAICQD